MGALWSSDLSGGLIFPDKTGYRQSVNGADASAFDAYESTPSFTQRLGRIGQDCPAPAFAPLPAGTRKGRAKGSNNAEAT